MRVLLFCLLLAGCATDRAPTSSSEEHVDNSHPAADIGDSFNVGAPRTVREKKAAPSQFFFKECSENGNDTYYSKTSYYCN